MVNKRHFAGECARGELPPLPYELNALEPTITGNLMDYHYNKHHKGYATNLKNLIG